MSWSHDEIERLAEADLVATGQTQPPFRPSLILQELCGVRVERGRAGGAQSQAVLIAGADPRCIVSSIVGSARGRQLVGHETGHARLGHVDLNALFPIPAQSAGHTLPAQKEREAWRYFSAVTMPRFVIEKELADSTRELGDLLRTFDVPERSLKNRLRELDLARLVYDLRNYRRWGWWPETRQPAYFTSLSLTQGRRQPLCERSGCERLATCVNHKHYESRGREEDEDLEALCAQHHYDEHVSGGAIR